MLGKTQNALLQKVEQQVSATVDPKFKQQFEKIIMAGMKVMYSDQTSGMMKKQLQKEGDPADKAGEGVAKLIGILFAESKQTMPMTAAIPAAQVLLCEGLGYMEEAGLVQVTNDVIADATKAMMGYILQIFGVSKEKIAEYMQAGMSAADNKMSKSAPAQPQGIIGQAQGGM